MNVNNAKTTNYKAIFILLGLIICLFCAVSTYFLIKTHNQNKIISEELLEYSNKLNLTKNRVLALDDNLEVRIQKLFNELDFFPNRLLFNPFYEDFFTHQNHYSIDSSTIRMLDKEYLITLNMSGFTKEQVKIELNDNALTIKAENFEKTNEGDDKNHINKQFKQVIRLNNDIEHDAIKSSLENGILTITIPRIQNKSETKTINIE
jgi:HSP20 family molecular chaperone IbpA